MARNQSAPVAPSSRRRDTSRLPTASTESIAITSRGQVRRASRSTAWVMRHERRWIKDAQRGSGEALEALYRRHWPWAHRAAYLVVHDRAAAEDIAQEAFLAAVRALDRFDRRRPFGPWLHRIVSIGRSTGRAPARSRRVELESEPGRWSRAPCGTRSPSGPVSDDVVRRLRRSRPTPGRRRPALPARVHAGRDRRDARASRGAPSTRACGGRSTASGGSSGATGERARLQSACARPRSPSGGGPRARPARRPRGVRGAPRRPLRPPPQPAWRSALARPLVAGSPEPGRRRGADLVRDAVEPARENARPALTSLPAPGRLLVTPEGPWIVAEDGSSGLLGAYDEAAWSPSGLFVAVTRGRQLTAVDPVGDGALVAGRAAPRSAPRLVAGGLPGRVPERRSLRVVAGDGTGDRRLVGPRLPRPARLEAASQTRAGRPGRDRAADERTRLR